MLVTHEITAADINSLLGKAIEQHKLGDLQNAKEIYLQTLAVDNRNYNAIHMLGVIALQEKNYSLAFELLQEAILIKSDDSRIFYNLGLAAYELEKFNLAEKYYLQSIALKNISSAVYSNLGSTYKRL